ncbi:conserved hypothetical protein [Vibrio crassostreae]|nr:conserved hypothetical protein [Vibrio crassostreae]CAK2811123.1 conserved hypothetical protein [Vibrio crassostreae]CAK3285775.1 conserved hypothetical protein [Vibrio crassostreae]CAK3850619.1 conserved hypothetical protein [Vibrio crassostreae]
MLYDFLRGFYYRYVAPHLAQATLLGYAQTTFTFVAIALGMSLYIFAAHEVFMFIFESVGAPLSFKTFNDANRYRFFIALVVSLYAVAAYTFALYGLWHIKTIIGAVKKWVKEVVAYSNQH